MRVTDQSGAVDQVSTVMEGEAAVQDKGRQDGWEGHPR